MKTFNEIKADYEVLLAAVESDVFRIDQSLSVLEKMEEPIYSDSSPYDSNEYFIYLQQLVGHAQLIKLAMSYAERLSALREEVSAKISSMRNYGAQFRNGEDLTIALGEIAMECEFLSGRFHSLSGDLDQKMLNLTSLYLNDNAVQNAFNVIAEEHRAIFDFCTPWLKYHNSEENNPIMAALRLLPDVNNQRIGLAN